MRNLIIAVIIALIAWLAYSQFKGQNKPENSPIVKYAEGLKSSEDKAAGAKDTANLAIIRSAISQFRGSQGRYPDSLQELVSKGYMDRVPDGISYDKESGEVNF
jgi:hypothetical protein